MQPKDGIHTTEFWLTAVTNIAGATLALLTAYGLLRREETELWLALLQALAVVIIPIVLSRVNTAYIQSRAQVKANGAAHKD
jgi:hypothetical protein